MAIARKYPKQVFWSDEDEGFIAIAPDLPGCSAFGDSEPDALAELDHAIEAWIDSAKAAGNNIPAPSSPAPRAHSGRLLVRMPRSLHQELVNGAQREGVSLNQFIIFVLSRYFSRSVSASEARAGLLSNVIMASSTTSSFAPSVTIHEATSTLEARTFYEMSRTRYQTVLVSGSWSSDLDDHLVLYHATTERIFNAFKVDQVRLADE